MPHSHPISATASVFIVGCGDIGRRIAHLEQAAGLPVAALVRSAAGSVELATCGITPVAGDLDRPQSLQGLPTAGAILYFLAPPPGTGRTDPRLAALLAAISPGRLPSRLVYISTSGVYGDCGGAWVDETTPLKPGSERAWRRLDAERQVREFCARTGVPGAILRVPGIYGPGRLPVERLRQGLPVVRQEEAPWSNRIHADDLAAVCRAAARGAAELDIYNASDGHPTSMTDYFNQVADLLQLARPPQVSLAEARRTLSPAMLSFIEESRRLDNRRMLRELAVQLRYPTLAEGLPACVGALQKT